MEFWQFLYIDSLWCHPKSSDVTHLRDQVYYLFNRRQTNVLLVKKKKKSWQYRCSSHAMISRKSYLWFNEMSLHPALQLRNFTGKNRERESGKWLKKTGKKESVYFIENLLSSSFNIITAFKSLAIKPGNCEFAVSQCRAFEGKLPEDVISGVLMLANLRC